jgi:hypothetical protein
MSEEFPVLELPPIAEVVCGIVFHAVGLDGLSYGVYADERKGEYPVQSLVPALTDGPDFIMGTPPLRAVLMSGSKVRVLQVQHDRLYTNWRAAGEEYPRFSTRGGKTGLLHDALEEFKRLQDFCSRRLGKALRVRHVELAKIDVLDPAKGHWTDLPDLMKVVPVCGAFGDLRQGITPELALRFVEREGGRILIVAVNSVHEPGTGRITSIRLETRAIEPIKSGDAMSEGFIQANRELNRAFFKLVNREELHRFGVLGGGNGPSGV